MIRTDPSSSLAGDATSTPAALVVNTTWCAPSRPPEPTLTPLEKLAWLAYVLPARIYATNPWLLDPKYQDWLQDPKTQDWLHDLKHREH
ncbi:MAG: hypothetical protein ACREP7_18900 [Lysobacter sp.]